MNVFISDVVFAVKLGELDLISYSNINKKIYNSMYYDWDSSGTEVFCNGSWDIAALNVVYDRS